MQRSLSSVPSYSDFALARYNGDGSPGVKFGTAGTCGISHRQAQSVTQNLGISISTITSRTGGCSNVKPCDSRRNRFRLVTVEALGGSSKPTGPKLSTPI